MSNSDSLRLALYKQQEKLGISSGNQEVLDRVMKDDGLGLQRLLALYYIEDIENELCQHLTDNLEGSEKDANSLLDDKIDLLSEDAKFRAFYESRGEFEKIVYLPFDDKFEEIMLNHKEDLRGIYDVTEDSVKAFGDSINTVLNIDEENEEINLSYSDIEKRNEDALDNDVTTLSLDSDNVDLDTYEKNRLNSLKGFREPSHRSKEEEEALDDIEDLIIDGYYDIADDLIDNMQEAYVSGGDIDISETIGPEVEAEVEAASDERLDEITADIEIDEESSELDSNELGEESEDDFGELGF